MTNCNKIAAGTLLSLSMVGCGWVDSAGSDGARDNNTVITSSDVLVAESVVSITEDDTTRFLLANAPQVSTGWTWVPDASVDALNLCRQEDDFDTDVAVTTLASACSAGTNCEFIIEESTNNSGTSFDLTLPPLRAPVALSYLLEATLASGEPYSQTQTICGIAINEAPDAQDDSYLALTSSTRRVEPDSVWAILSNDTDDDHVRNQTLFIKQVTTPPIYAANVELLSNGSFEYTARSDLNLSDNESLEDSMEIVVSDGTHDSTSIVTVRLVNNNTRPTTISGGIPDIVAPVDEGASNDLFIDFNDFIVNTDNDPLRFHLIGGNLTESGVLSFDESGVLSGTLTLDDVGREQFTLVITDGLFEVSESFELTISDERPRNRDPEVDDIPNTRVSGSFSYNVAEFFTDPDGDELTYRSDNLPPGVTITDAGVVSGTAATDNDGRWLIRITASDNRGGTATDQFRMTIDLN